MTNICKLHDVLRDNIVPEKSSFKLLHKKVLNICLCLVTEKLFNVSRDSETFNNIIIGYISS